LAFTEDVEQRFQAFGWHVTEVDGHVAGLVAEGIDEARRVNDRPSLIMVKTTIGYGSPNKAGTSKAHGSPLGPDEVKLTKEALGIPLEPEFYVSSDVALAMDASANGEVRVADWDARFLAYAAEYPAEAAELQLIIDGELPAGWQDVLPSFTDTMATRKNGEAVLAALGKVIPSLLGGSADLAESTFTHIHGETSFQKNNLTGRNFCFGVREHAMAAACNGMQLHGLKAVASSFVQFTDYCRPSIRLAALMECPSLFVFTHDSIGLGEDGPTHQPVEHLAAMRAIPNLNTFRPADGNETSAGRQLCANVPGSVTCGP
jgi:transketolase